MPRATGRDRCRQTWKRLINLFDHLLYHCQKLDDYYVGYDEHQEVVRMITQMIVDTQALAEKWFKEKV